MYIGVLRQHGAASRVAPLIKYKMEKCVTPSYLPNLSHFHLDDEVKTGWIMNISEKTAFRDGF
jgi:hypothetical protein